MKGTGRTLTCWLCPCGGNLVVILDSSWESSSDPSFCNILSSPCSKSAPAGSERGRPRGEKLPASIEVKDLCAAPCCWVSVCASLSISALPSTPSPWLGLLASLAQENCATSRPAPGNSKAKTEQLKTSDDEEFLVPQNCPAQLWELLLMGGFSLGLTPKIGNTSRLSCADGTCGRYLCDRTKRAQIKILAGPGGSML